MAIKFFNNYTDENEMYGVPNFDAQQMHENIDTNYNYKDLVKNYKARKKDGSNTIDDLYKISTILAQKKIGGNKDRYTDTDVSKEIDSQFDNLINAANETGNFNNDETFTNFHFAKSDQPKTLGEWYAASADPEKSQTLEKFNPYSNGQIYRNERIMENNPLEIGLNNMSNINNALGYGVGQISKNIPGLNNIDPSVVEGAVNTAGDIGAAATGAALGTAIFPGIGTVIGGIALPLLKNVGKIGNNFTQVARGKDIVTGAELSDNDKLEKNLDTAMEVASDAAFGLGPLFKGLKLGKVATPALENGAKTAIEEGSKGISKILENAKSLPKTAGRNLANSFINAGGTLAPHGITSSLTGYVPLNATLSGLPTSIPTMFLNNSRLVGGLPAKYIAKSLGKEIPEMTAKEANKLIMAAPLKFNNKIGTWAAKGGFGLLNTLPVGFSVAHDTEDSKTNFTPNSDAGKSQNIFNNRIYSTMISRRNKPNSNDWMFDYINRR